MMLGRGPEGAPYKYCDHFGTPYSHKTRNIPCELDAVVRIGGETFPRTSSQRRSEEEVPRVFHRGKWPLLFLVDNF